MQSEPRFDVTFSAIVIFVHLSSTALTGQIFRFHEIFVNPLRCDRPNCSISRNFCQSLTVETGQNVQFHIIFVNFHSSSIIFLLDFTRYLTILAMWRIFANLFVHYLVFDSTHLWKFALSLFWFISKVDSFTFHRLCFRRFFSGTIHPGEFRSLWNHFCL